MLSKPNIRIPILKKMMSIFLVLSLIFVPASMFAGAAGDDGKGTSYQYIFVSGFAGWGHYEALDQILPYWGRLNGDLMEYLNRQGYESYAASIDPLGSAWHRACELYAQLTGTVVDYGEVHSATNNHARFGRDFSSEPLITGWGETDKNDELKKINLVGHSFGGATIRIFAELMANGAKEEIEGTTTGEVSGLFTGGKAGWIYSITTLAAPHNGTALTLLTSPIAYFDSIGAVHKLDVLQKNATYQYLKDIGKLMSPAEDEDTGVYDLSLDGAAKLNKDITTIKNIYYFSFPTDATTALFLSTKRVPSMSAADPLLWPTITVLGAKTGVTGGGIVFDKSWYNNDGIVNTVSTIAPKKEAQKAFAAGNIQPGIWNIMDTFKGDHAAIIGGLSHAVDINAFYLKQLKLINAL